MSARPLRGNQLVQAIGSQLSRLETYGTDNLTSKQVRAVAELLRKCAARIQLQAIERGPWVALDDGGAE